MEKTIVVELTRVARRISLLRWGWSLAILVAALVAAVLATISFRGESVVLSKEFWSPAAVAAAIWLLLSAILIWRFAPSRLQVARRIESQYPELRQSLLTSIDPQANLWANPLLTREAVRTSNRHRMLNRWTAIIPTWQYAAVGAAQLLVMASALAVGGWLTVRYAEGRSERPAPKLAAGETLRVEPGDVEIERGSSLTVAATFAGPPPIEVELGMLAKGSEIKSDATRSDDGESEAADDETAGAEPSFRAMRQRLRDPVYTALLSNVREDLEYWVRHDRDQSKQYTIRVFDYPALQRTDASLKYPAYTARESETIEDTRRVRIVEGTTVRWTLQVNKPGIDAAMVGPDETRLSAQPDADDPLRLAVAMDSPAGGRWRIELIDSQGRRAKLEESVVVTVVPNLPPQIKLTAGADASVSPLEEWLAAADVNDDFGIIRSGLSYSFHGDQVELEIGTPKEPPASPQAVPQPDVAPVAAELRTVAADPQRAEVSNRFDMERLSAEVDDSLTYWFWAEDYDAAGNVRRTRSDLYFADVRPLEEIFRQGQPPPGGQPGQQGQQPGGSQATEELLELQRNIVAATWKLQGRSDSGEADDALAADVETIRQSQEAAVEKLAEAASRQNDPRSQQIVADIDIAMQEAVADLASFTAKSDQAGDEDPLEDPLDEALGAEQAAYQGLLKLRAREFEISQSQQSQSLGGGAAGAARQRQIDQLKLDAEQNRYETQSQAQQQQDPAAAEADREMLDRLKQLAQRQTDLNEQIRQLEAALQAAQTPEERQEAEEQLKRLRDAQQQLLRDADEALDQMQQNQQGQQSQQNAQQQLSEARQNMQQAAEALQQGQPSQALSAGTRGQQSLQKSEEELRSRSAEQLTDSLRELRSQSQGLAERQQQIRESLQEQNADTAGGSLRGGDTRQQLEQDAAQQIQELQQLQERMQETVLQAETAEPLLADSLYDAFRKTQQQQLDEQLQMQSTLINNSMDPEATRLSGRAAQALEQLQQEIGDASANLLGSDTADLERAVDQLQELKDQIAAEASAATGRRVGQANAERRGGGSPQPSEPQQPGETQPQDSQGGQSASGQQPEGQQGGEQQPGEPQGSEQQSSEQQPGEQQSGGQQPGGQQGSGQQPGEQPSGGQQPGGAGQQPGSGQPGGGSNGSSRSGSSPNGSSPNGSSPNGSGSGGGVRGGADAAGGFEAGVGGLLEQLQADSQRRQQAADSPLTGDAFREWNDSLRGVEQLLDNEEDRAAAANVRQAARTMRSEVRRHASEPNWEAVEELIVDPLDDLIERVGEELRRRQGGDDLVVPLDRDPVPPGFEQAVRMYYENLGAGR